MHIDEKYLMTGGGSLAFSAAARETFKAHRQHPWQNEAGGILLGRLFTSSDASVDVATKPSRKDRAGRTYFERSRSAAQLLVNTAWERSDGREIYLGEWHTHSVPRPEPSGRDRAMISNMLRESRMEIDFLILVIVGLTDVWVGYQDNNKLTRVHPTQRVGDARDISAD